MPLTRVINFLLGFIRGRNYYGRYLKMYGRDLREVPSFKLVSSFSHGRILDVGCGIGYLSSLFHDYIGIDTNKKAITIAKKNTNFDYVIASATNLPFRSGVFDGCISYDSIEHINNVNHALAEMRRVSDKAVISCADFGSYYRFFTYDKTHVKRPMPDELFVLSTRYFTHVRLFRTSGLFVVPKPVNLFLAKYFPNQIVLEARLM